MNGAIGLPERYTPGAPCQAFNPVRALKEVPPHEAPAGLRADCAFVFRQNTEHQQNSDCSDEACYNPETDAVD